MKTQCLISDDDILNPVLVEQLEQISEVLLSFHGIDLLEIQWLRFALWVSY